MEFPVYRKYSNHHAYFIITSPITWIEYKKIGQKYIRFEFTATQYPEKLMMKDLMELKEGLESNPEEINALNL